jgi:isopenicillin N synthase-like dioxygenase
MISPRVATPEKCAEALLEHHYAIIRLPDLIRAEADAIQKESFRFFAMEEGFKARCASPALQEGYRELYAEVDKVTGRPDLSESFKAWFRNIGKREIEAWAADCALHRTMVRGLGPYCDLGASLLKALKNKLNAGSRDRALGIDIWRDTYLQIKYSKPSRETRDTVMDVHEDGHLLTIVRPSSSGLMACPGSMIKAPTRDNPFGVYQPDGPMSALDVDEGDAVIVPSTPTFLLTGGRVKPLFHCVATTTVEARTSVILFMNPARGEPLRAWVRTEFNDEMDVGLFAHTITQSHYRRHGWEDEDTATPERFG